MQWRNVCSWAWNLWWEYRLTMTNLNLLEATSSAIVLRKPSILSSKITYAEARKFECDSASREDGGMFIQSGHVLASKASLGCALEGDILPRRMNWAYFCAVFWRHRHYSESVWLWKPAIALLGIPPNWPRGRFPCLPYLGKGNGGTRQSQKRRNTIGSQAPESIWQGFNRFPQWSSDG